MVDHILSQEKQEFEALVSSMRDQEDQQQHNAMSDYDSDEEVYDQLFMEVISEEESAEIKSLTVGASATVLDQEMDISCG